MSQRVFFIEHRGKRIIYHDWSDLLRPEDALAAVAESAPIVRAQPAGSALTLVNVSNSRFNKEIIDAVKALMAGNKPHVKASALVGLSGIMRVVYVTVTQFTGRRIPTFSSEEEAKDYLVDCP